MFKFVQLSSNPIIGPYCPFVVALTFFHTYCCGVYLFVFFSCSRLEQWWLCQANVIFSMLQKLPSPSIVQWKFDEGKKGEREKKKHRMFCFEENSLWEWCLLRNWQKKSCSLERNLEPSFVLDSTTDFTEMDADVNKGQLSLGERGLVWIRIVSAEVTGIYRCKESKIRSKTALDVFNVLRMWIWIQMRRGWLDTAFFCHRE